MASVARDNLEVIRIPRKVIVAELVKKLGGSEVQYDCRFEEGNYWCIARTVIATTEPETSGKLEEALGCFDATEERAEEAAAIAMIDLLKKTYKLEIDDVNFVKRARAEHRAEQLERDVHAHIQTENSQNETLGKAKKGWNQLLDDMSFVHEVCEDACGDALATLPVDYKSGPFTDMIYSVCCLNDWTEQKIFESTANLNETEK